MCRLHHLFLAFAVHVIGGSAVALTQRRAVKRLTVESNTYGFYQHVFRQPKAVIHQVQSIREIYPAAPIYISSDGGLNFTGLCASAYPCKFVWSPPANDRLNPKPFLDRFRAAAEWLQTTYVVFMEPDVTLHQPISKPCNADGCGITDWWNKKLSAGLRAHLTQVGKNASGNSSFVLPWERFGLCGGSILLREAVLNAFWPDAIDWKHMELLERGQSKKKYDGPRIYASDIAMPIALAVHGYTYYPWDDIRQVSRGLRKQVPVVFGNKYRNGPVEETAFVHHSFPDKPFYHNHSFTPEELTFFEEPSIKIQNVTCTGCIWVQDAALLEQARPQH